ncbi:hypothetical protein BJ944DRAFT_262067, partial [Cunninghamella echinulata]
MYMYMYTSCFFIYCPSFFMILSFFSNKYKKKTPLFIISTLIIDTCTYIYLFTAIIWI